MKITVLKNKVTKNQEKIGLYIYKLLKNYVSLYGFPKNLLLEKGKKEGEELQKQIQETINKQNELLQLENRLDKQISLLDEENVELKNKILM